MSNSIRIEARVFPNLTGLKGMPALLVDEMKLRYLTAVSKTNEIFERLERVDYRNAHPVFSEIRSLLTALPQTLGTVKSYEMFFAQIGGSAGRPSAAVAEHIRRDFGSHEAFIEQLTATALSSRCWAAVVFDLDLRRLMCVMGDSPEQLTVWNTSPVIVLEVSGKGSAPSHEPNRTVHIQTLISLLDWRVVERNIEDALGLQSAGGKPY